MINEKIKDWNYSFADVVFCRCSFGIGKNNEEDQNGAEVVFGKICQQQVEVIRLTRYE